jgi:hypothetical protein
MAESKYEKYPQKVLKLIVKEMKKKYDDFLDNNSTAGNPFENEEINRFIHFCVSRFGFIDLIPIDYSFFWELYLQNENNESESLIIPKVQKYNVEIKTVTNESWIRYYNLPLNLYSENSIRDYIEDNDLWWDGIEFDADPIETDTIEMSISEINKVDGVLSENKITNELKRLMNMRDTIDRQISNLKKRLP